MGPSTPDMRPPKAAPMLPPAFKAPETRARWEAGKTSAESAKSTGKEPPMATPVQIRAMKK